MLSWLLTQPMQPCPWCGQLKAVGALDPCGHIVCRSCWYEGTFAECPICHRRVAIGDPFVRAATTMELVTHHDGELRLLHLGFDLVGAARVRFEQLVGRASPLSPEERTEIEAVIDAMGPKAVHWLPARIPIKETMAIALALLWTVAPDRAAMLHATRGHLTTATDVLRVAAVLLGGNPGLTEPMRLGSVGRSMRRAVLEALDHLPAEQAIEDMWRHRGLWKRIGERLHPYEYAERLPVATLAFAAVRQTKLDTATFGAAIRNEARGTATVRIVDDRARVMPWANFIEDRLRAGDARSAAERLEQQPDELLRRVDHLVRVVQVHQPDALAQVIGTIEAAAARGSPAMLLRLASHIARRTEPWPRRVFFPKRELLKAWGAPDRRAPLRSDAIGALVALARAELVNRAAARRNFARAVIDRSLVDLAVPAGERAAPKAKIAWPRGSEIALPPAAAGNPLRWFLHWEEPLGTNVDLDLSVEMFDAQWRHVVSCDLQTPVVDQRVVVHSGDLRSAPPPLGASEFVDLDLERLPLLGVRYAMMVVSSFNAIPPDQLTYRFAGIMIRPRDGDPFDPRTAAQRFDLHGKSAISVPLVIDLETRRLRWLDAQISGPTALRKVGGYRAALAHIGRDFADVASTGARPTLWDLATLHAVARANIIYVRERSGEIAVYRRRDTEQALARLARLHAGEAPDDVLEKLPPANAPTWFALLRDDLDLPAGSTGYVLTPHTTSEGIEHLSATGLLGELTR
jgi:hypothetical protein